MSEKLIVHYDMTHLDILVALLPTILRRLGFLGLFLFIGFHFLFKSILLDIIIITIFLGLSILFILFGSVCSIISDGYPALILDDKGAKFTFYGFVPWDNIENVYIFSAPNGIEILYFTFKDIRKILPNVSFWVKIGIYNQILFRTKRHVCLTNLVIPFKTIIEYSKEHI